MSRIRQAGPLSQVLSALLPWISFLMHFLRVEFRIGAFVLQAAGHRRQVVDPSLEDGRGSVSQNLP
jgi:hypothetical protein